MDAKLAVWFNNVRIGDIFPAGVGTLVFQYSSQWLEAGDSFPISLSLPLRKAPFTNELSSAFFDNLLPEENVRRHVAETYQLSIENIYGLLEAIGGDCAGALSIVPANHSASSGNYDYHKLPIEELPDFLAAHRAHPLADRHKKFRLSLAGAQSKASLYISDDTHEVLIPQGEAPGTHIVKPGSLTYSHLAENELFCTLLAKCMGLDTPEASLTPTLERAFLSSRYDRQRQEDGRIRRVHQEDFCQALGLPPSKKYQSHGGPGYKQCFRVLDACHNPREDKRKLFLWIVFNYLIGNADAHAKNISLLYDQPPKPRLAPFYDLVSTAIYPNLGKNMAMKIGRVKHPHYVYGDDWLKVMEQAELNIDEGLSLIKDFALLSDPFLDEASAKFQETYGQIPVISRIVSLIKERKSLLLAALEKIHSK